MLEQLSVALLLCLFVVFTVTHCYCYKCGQINDDDDDNRNVHLWVKPLMFHRALNTSNDVVPRKEVPFGVRKIKFNI